MRNALIIFFIATILIIYAVYSQIKGFDNGCTQKIFSLIFLASWCYLVNEIYKYKK